MKMRKTKRLVSLLLGMVLLMANLSWNVFAAEPDADNIGRNAISSSENWQETMFQMMGFASAVGGGSDKYFAEGTAAPAGTVFQFLNMTEELNAYVDADGYVDIPYEEYMNIADAYFVNAPEMKTYLTDRESMNADTEQVHYYQGGMGSDWSWTLCEAESCADGYKLKGIFCSGWLEDTTGFTEYIDYYGGLRLQSAIELYVTEDAEHGWQIAAYSELDYYKTETEEMGICYYVYNEETDSFSDIYYDIHISDNVGAGIQLEEGTYTVIDHHLCYSLDQEVKWTAICTDGIECQVEVERIFDGEILKSVEETSGVISGGGAAALKVNTMAIFDIDAEHAAVEIVQGLTDLGNGTYAYYPADAIELRITPDAGYEITEVASYLFDVYVVEGTYISASGTWVIMPEFISSTILVTTKETEEDTVTIVSGSDSAVEVTVQVPKEETEKVEGLTLVVEKLEETVEEKAVTLVVEQLDVEEDDVYILDIHFENAAGEEEKVNASMIVTVPIPEGWDPASVSVYYVNSETGEVVDMKAVVSEDGKTVTFTTNHFSYYALVQKAAPEQTKPIDPAVTTGNPDTSNPKMGDSSNTGFWFTLLILAAAGMTVMVLYGRKEKSQG